jgi:hypothetical protein
MKALMLILLGLLSVSAVAADIKLTNGLIYRNARLYDVTPKGQVYLWVAGLGAKPVFYGELPPDVKAEVLALIATRKKDEERGREEAAKAAESAAKLRRERVGTAKTFVIQTKMGKTYEGVVSWQLEAEGTVQFYHTGGMARHKLDDLIGTSRELVSKPPAK